MTGDPLAPMADPDDVVAAERAGHRLQSGDHLPSPITRNGHGRSLLERAGVDDLVAEEEAAALRQLYEGGKADAEVPQADNPFEASLLTSAQITDLPPPDYLIDDYLVRDSLALLYGSSGTGKTFVACDWALHVATASWWNGNAVKPGSVVYVIAEGARGTGKRLAAWQQHHQVYDLTRHQPIMWRTTAANLTDLPEVLALCSYVERTRPALVVFDTLARCTLGAEENSARDMGLVVANMDRVRRSSGACVLAVHHTGKDGAAGARGSSALRAAMDTELEVTAVDHRLTLRVTKQKDGAEARPLRLDRKVVGESCVIVPAGRDTEPEDIGAGELTTLEALRTVQTPAGVADGVWKDVAAEAGVARTSYYRHKARLLERGVVQDVGTIHRPKFVTIDADAGTSEADA